MSEQELTPEELAAQEALKAEQAAAAKAKKEQEAAEKKAAKEAEKKAKAEKKAADAAAKKAEKAAAEEAKKAERAAAKLEKNGVSRPLSGATKGVWDIADKISTETKAPAERAAVVAAGKEAGYQEGTINTQYGRWRRFHGLTVAREVKPKTPEVPQQDLPPETEGVDVPQVDAPSVPPAAETQAE